MKEKANKEDLNRAKFGITVKSKDFWSNLRKFDFSSYEKAILNPYTSNPLITNREKTDTQEDIKKTRTVLNTYIESRKATGIHEFFPKRNTW